MELKDAVMVVALCAVAYLVAMEVVRIRKVKNCIHIFLLAVWASGLFYMTIGMREGSGIHERTLIPFYSYYVLMNGGSQEIIRTNLMNVLLFVPGGLFAGCLLPENGKMWIRVLAVAVLFAVVSAGIEWAQYHFSLGTSEVDDVIHNTIGAMAGALGAFSFQQWKKGIRQE